MKLTIPLFAIAVLAGAVATAQESTVKTETTVQSGEGTRTMTRTTTITGNVVRYEPGKTIVLRHPDSRIVTYTLVPSLTVPADVQIGRSVWIETEPSDAGVVRVTRLMTVMPAGAAPAAKTETLIRTTTVTGDLVRYEPGRLIAVRQPDGQVTTYMLAPTLTIPAEVQIGKKISLVTEPSNAGQTLVTRITTVTTEGAGVAASMGQTSSSTRETTMASTAGGQTTTMTKTTTISGDVVSYEPGRTIVLRQPDGQVVTYAIGPSAVVPAEVQIGRRVSIATEPSPSGTVLVTRVTTQSLTPEGDVQTMTRKTEMSPEGEETTQITTVSGTVTAYEPGKTVTVIQPDKKTVTYIVDAASEVPKDFAVGKQVTLRTTRVAGSEMPVVRKVTYTTRSKTTKKKY